MIKNHHNEKEIGKNRMLTILHFADVYDALTSERAYKKAMTKKDAIAEIGKEIKAKKIKLTDLYKKTA